MLTPEQIAGPCGAPIANVRLTWPLVLAALQREGMPGILTQIGAAATIGVETWVTRHGVNQTFLPIEELGTPEYLDRYHGYWGRGLIQLTWLANYEKYGRRIGHDLAGQPALALQPPIAADVLAAFFKDQGVAAACEVQDWTRARHLVNGGSNGLARFRAIVTDLLKAQGLAA